MKKQRKPLTESRLKALTVEAFFIVLIAYAFLALFHAAGTFVVSSGSWIVLFVLTAFAAVQWSVFVCALYYTGSLLSKSKPRSVLKCAGVFLPSIVAIVGVILYFGIEELNIFNVEIGNFFGALGIFAAACVVAGLLVYGIKKIAGAFGWTVDFDAQSASKLPQEDPMEENEAPIPVDFSSRRRAGEEKFSRAGAPDFTEGTQGAAKETAGKPKDVFSDLLSIDEYYRENPYRPTPSAKFTLKNLCDGFNTYLESRKMYYTAETVRSFLAGMACARFLILEGLSGTGKTSLPKYFAEYVGCNVCFTSVQASWKDRSDILGYYNDFTGKFKETPFLRSLYTASYRSGEINLMVLDEMNLSRVEYYFADFLSVLELDEDNWKIELMPVSTQGNLPEKLVDGCCVRIPSNTWFIGTANRDDSTFTITDKVYDRAAVIDFSKRNEPVADVPAVKPVHIDMAELASLFAEAINSSEYNLTREEYARFSALGQFMLEKFDINFGNRILNQIMKFVPVYVACGGSPAKALDIMFARKILRKLDGRFEDGLKSNLVKLETYIAEKYGAEEFSITLETIAKLKRKLI